MNTTIKSLLAAAILSLVIPTAQAGVKVIGTLPNGDKIVRIKTFGLFCPATTTVITVKADGDVQTLNQAGGPGVVPAVANAGGLVGAATQLRPARSNTQVQQAGGGANATNVNAPSNNTTTTTTVTAPPSNTTVNNFVPPGHQN